MEFQAAAFIQFAVKDLILQGEFVKVRLTLVGAGGGSA
jgi:hypothetical protein